MSIFPHHTSDPICRLCEDKLQAVKKELQDWFHAVKAKYPSVHISWGYRDQADQDAVFAQGKSREKFPMSPHNKTPAMAIDIFQINDKGQAVFDTAFFASLAATIKEQRLPFIWGGWFSTISDKDHFQFNPDADS
jgi:hypothetical protein